MELRYVTIDCADPERLAAFWAAAIGYVRERAHGPYVTLVHPQGRDPRLVFQRVPEPKAGKNRVHLDLGGEEMTAAVARLEALGARRVRLHDVEDEGRWTILLDPEGNEFCVMG